MTGSALDHSKGYSPGVQAWYNQFLGVDPLDAQHLYVGLEEVYETTDGGNSWTTIGPYWNFGLPCSANGLDSCPKTTHSDQHAIAFGGGTVFVGSDGGVWSRPVRNATGWTDLNATLHTLQYYSASAGPVSGGLAYWGGLQDNGESLLLPRGRTMVSPFGGDGGRTIVVYGNVLPWLSEQLGLTAWNAEALHALAGLCAIYPPERGARCDPTPKGGFSPDCAKGGCAVSGADAGAGSSAMWLAIFAAIALRRRS